MTDKKTTEEIETEIRSTMTPDMGPGVKRVLEARIAKMKGLAAPPDMEAQLPKLPAATAETVEASLQSVLAPGLSDSMRRLVENKLAQLKQNQGESTDSAPGSPSPKPKP